MAGASHRETGEPGDKSPLTWPPDSSAWNDSANWHAAGAAPDAGPSANGAPGLVDEVTFGSAANGSPA